MSTTVTSPATQPIATTGPLSIATATAANDPVAGVDGAGEAAALPSFAAALDLAVALTDLLGEADVAAAIAPEDANRKLATSEQIAADASSLLDPAALQFAAFLPDASRMAADVAPAASKAASGEEILPLPTTAARAMPLATRVAPGIDAAESAKPARESLATPIAAAVAPAAVVATELRATDAKRSSEVVPPEAPAPAVLTLQGAHPEAHSPARTPVIAVSAPVASAGFGPEIAVHVQYAASRGIETVSLEVTPPHLGPVDVQIRVVDGTAQLHFTADSAIAREAIVDAIPRLRERLAEEGIALGGASVGSQSPRRDSERDTSSASRGSEPGAVPGVTDATESAVRSRLGALRLVDDFA